MRTRIRANAIPLGLAALAFAFAIAQRPGWSSSDTKIDLHVDPVRFLSEIAYLWTPSSGLGGVESAQYAGYLFPMGPFFALGHLVGVSDWLVDRLWLGLLLAVGCWGVVRLVEALGATRTALGGALAGLVFLLNPYVVVLTNRTTITLLAYALMPWLVLVALRGVREPRRWTWPALFALLVTSSGAGVNAAVVALVLLAPAALLFFEAGVGVIGWRAVWRFGWWAALFGLVASLWWIAPAVAQTRYGVDFLRFTEPAGAIWATTSLSESFRAMGYWISYIGVGFNGVVRPYFSDAGTLLFNHAVVTATLLVPGLALGGFAWTRRRRYAAYFLLLVLLGTLVMAIGFPDGTPFRRGATFAYNHVASVRFLRTTYKAGPLVVLGVAGLAGMGVEAVVRRGARLAVSVAAVALLLIAAWPLTSGKAVDKQVSWKRIPAGWVAAGKDLDRQLGDNARAAVLPGQLYAFYRWGGTVDPILPSLSQKPVAVRNAVPYGDLRATDLLWSTDALLQQERLLPGQLEPLLQLMSVRDVVNATDDDVFRSGASDPHRAAQALAAQGLARRHEYGDGVQSFAVPAAKPLVRVERRGPLNVVDGSAGGLADLASFAPDPGRAGAPLGTEAGGRPLGAEAGGRPFGAGPPLPAPFAYAADLRPQAIRAAAAHGGRVVISDSNRRRVFVVSRMQQNTGWTLGARDPISADAATLDPFPERGSDAQTVAVFHGARSITAPFSPGYSQFPEHRPFAAFDGDPRTAWLADPALQPQREVLTIAFTSPRDVDVIDVLPRNEAGARVTALVVNGRRFGVGPGWAHLRLGLKRVGALSIRVIAAKTGSAGAGGLAEVRVPGLHVTESLRPPVLAERALRGVDLSHSTLEYSFNRASGDNPRTHASSAGVRVENRVTRPTRLEQLRVEGAGDEETGIDRVIEPPAARSYDVSAWLSVSPEAPDSSIDRLVGARTAGLASQGDELRADSSGRLDNRPAFRASSAFDGDPATAWIAPVSPAKTCQTRPNGGQAAPWIRVSMRRALAIRRLSIQPARGARVPTCVEVAWPGGRSGALRVVAGRVVLPRAIRTRSFKLTVVAAAGRGRGVGIAELRAAGLPSMDIPRSGKLRGCGALAVVGGARTVAMRVAGDIADLDAGRPLRATGCGKVELAAGVQRVQIPARVLRPDTVLLSSPAPNPLAQPAIATGAVSDPGDPAPGSRSGVKLRVARPAWLVLGESYDRGWRAWCDGKALGAPVPLDGFANAWPIQPGCANARFAFAPQKPVHVIQILSGLACLLLLIGVAFGRARGGRMRVGDPRAAAAHPPRAGNPRAAPAHPPRAGDPRAAPAHPPRAGDPRAAPAHPPRAARDPYAAAEWPDLVPARVRLSRAVPIALAAAAVLAFCFSLRSGLVIAPAVAIVLWRGIRAKPLAIAGGLLLAVAVPLDYIVFPAQNLGGYNPAYADEHISGHWIAVAAWVLLALALWRVLSTATRRRGDRAAAPADAAG